MSFENAMHNTRRDSFLLKEDAKNSAKKIIEEVEKYNKGNCFKNVLKNVREFYIEVKCQYSGCHIWVADRDITTKRIFCNIYYRNELVYTFDVVYLYDKTDDSGNLYNVKIAKELKKHGYSGFKFFKQDLVCFKARKTL